MSLYIPSFSIDESREDSGLYVAARRIALRSLIVWSDFISQSIASACDIVSSMCCAVPMAYPMACPWTPMRAPFGRRRGMRPVFFHWSYMYTPSGQLYCGFCPLELIATKSISVCRLISSVAISGWISLVILNASPMSFSYQSMPVFSCCSWKRTSSTARLTALLKLILLSGFVLRRTKALATSFTLMRPFFPVPLTFLELRSDSRSASISIARRRTGSSRSDLSDRGAASCTINAPSVRGLKANFVQPSASSPLSPRLSCRIFKLSYRSSQRLSANAKTASWDTRWPSIMLSFSKSR